jgi:mRNA-degrading endonuclease RelE of RelBE toxin-antitoxin system
MALMTDAPSIQILVAPDFQGQLRKLAKRYRNIRSDLQPLFDDLESGNCPGDQISGATYTVFKVSVKNSDIQKGKNSGYRVIYQLRDKICILLVTIYSKSDEVTLAASEIREIIDRFNQPNTTPDPEI